LQIWNYFFTFVNLPKREQVLLQGLVHLFWHVSKFVIKCFKLININIRTKKLQYKNKNKSRKRKQREKKVNHTRARTTDPCSKSRAPKPLSNPSSHVCLCNSEFMFGSSLSLYDYIMCGPDQPSSHGLPFILYFVKPSACCYKI